MMYRSREQAAYARLIAGATGIGPPLLAGAAAGLGKTHGYSIPLLQSGRRVAIAMSTRQLIEQYMQSEALKAAQSVAPATVAVLQPRGQFVSDRSYREHREQALSAQVLVITQAAALIDSLNPGYAALRERDVVLFDEADLLADAADLRSTFSISPETLLECGAEGADPRTAAMLVKSKAERTEDRVAAAAVLYALDHPAWYKVVGLDDDDGALTLKHRMPGRMLGPLVRDARRCIFTSGTLQVSGRFDYFVMALGLRTIDPASRHIDPAHHGVLDIQPVPAELTVDEKAQRIRAAARPALVLTTSHTDTQALGALIPEATVRRPDEPLLDALARCPDDGILVAAGAWSGLDAPRLRWKTVVIPKAPYGPPSTIDGQGVTRYIDSRVTAVRRICQGLHRGLRTPDAECALLLLDPRCSRPELREAIPSRFRVAWESFEEGERQDALVNEAKRYASLRPRALKHYGARCSWPGCQETNPAWLEVHHKDPVSEGVRRTTMDDLAVLCANHHRETHWAMREAKKSGVEVREIDARSSS